MARKAQSNCGKPQSKRTKKRAGRRTRKGRKVNSSTSSDVGGVVNKAKTVRPKRRTSTRVAKRPDRKNRVAKKDRIDRSVLSTIISTGSSKYSVNFEGSGKEVLGRLRCGDYSRYSRYSRQFMLIKKMKKMLKEEFVKLASSSSLKTYSSNSLLNVDCDPDEQVTIKMKFQVQPKQQGDSPVNRIVPDSIKIKGGETGSNAPTNNKTDTVKAAPLKNDSKRKIDLDDSAKTLFGFTTAASSNNASSDNGKALCFRPDKSQTVVGLKNSADPQTPDGNLVGPEAPVKGINDSALAGGGGRLHKQATSLDDSTNGKLQLERLTSCYNLLL